MEKVIKKTLIKIILGNITEQDTEAIVNAANSGLLGGGGVDGAIHAAGGPKILEECKAIRARQGKCPTGNAVVTGGGRLRARCVIHAVGPVWFLGLQNEDEKLRSAFLSSLHLAQELGIRSISFPSISTGAYRYPVDQAARIALQTVYDFVKFQTFFEEVRFVLFSKSIFKVFEKTWMEIIKE